MSESVVAVFIPIIFTLAAAAVGITFIYFRSREKQMIIDKNLDYEQVKELYEKKRTPYLGLKTGVIILAFGIGLSFGLVGKEFTNYDFFIPMGIFIFTGLGFMAAHYVAKKEEAKVKNNLSE